MQRYNCVVFTSADNKIVAEDSREVISNSMNISKVFTNNRQSTSISSLMSEILQLGEIDYVFNYLAPKKFPKWLIDFPKFGCINFHPGSYKYPGVGSASYAIFNQDSEFGLTAHWMNNSFDSGDIVHEIFFEIKEEWGCFELFNAALSQSKLLLSETIQILIKEPKPSKVRDWDGPAKTRKDFLDWMIYKVGNDDRDLDLLVKSVKHPEFSGPFIQFAGHQFAYKP